jgi:hypothetical protein
MAARQEVKPGLGRRTGASVHNDWLTLVEPVGAFLTIPVLKRVFPNGIPPVERDTRGEVRQRLDDLTSDVASRTSWLQWILRDLLSLGSRLREASAMPADRCAGVRSWPAGRARPDAVGRGSASAGRR